MTRQEYEAYQHTIEACINLVWRSPIPAKVAQVHVRRLEKLKGLLLDVFEGGIPLEFISDEVQEAVKRPLEVETQAEVLRP